AAQLVEVFEERHLPAELTPLALLFVVRVKKGRSHLVSFKSESRAGMKDESRSRRRRAVRDAGRASARSRRVQLHVPLFACARSARAFVRAALAPRFTSAGRVARDRAALVLR